MKKRETGRRGGWLAYIRTYGPFRAPDGLFLGVAKGLAGHFGWSVALTRLALAVLFLFFWPTLLFYLGAACLLGPAPGEEFRGRFQTGFDPAAALNRLGRRAETLEKRLRRLEHIVTSRDFAWRRRYGAGGCQ